MRFNEYYQSTCFYLPPTHQILWESPVSLHDMYSNLWDVTGRFNNRSNATLYCWPVNACSWCITLRMTSTNGLNRWRQYGWSWSGLLTSFKTWLANRCLGYQERDASRCFCFLLQQGKECGLEYVVASTHFLASFCESVDFPLRLYTNITRLKIVWPINISRQCVNRCVLQY